MNRRTKLALARDKNIKAQHAGKRTSADGNTYYEYRENRSDVNRTKRFGKGGDLWTPLDFTSIEEYFDYINDSLINGNRTQVKELYNDMDESQKKQFFRYANMQEGMFDEVVDYINENVREYANGGGIENVRINTKLEALQETESKDFNDKSPYYAKVGTIGTVIDIIGSKYKVQLDNLDTILVHKLDIGDYWGIYNFEYRKGDDVYILENYNKNPYAAPIKKEGKVIDFDGKDVSVEWSDGSASTLNQRFLYKEKYAKGGGVSVLKDKIDHINKNYDGVVASKTYSDNRIQVVSPYFNTLNDIKRNEFDGSGLLERYGNTTQYVLYSNKTYAKGGVLDEKESMLHFVLNQLPSGTVANMSSYSDYKTIDKIKSQIINILQEEGDVKYSIYNLKSLIKRAEQEIEEPADRSYMNTEVGKVDVYSGMSKFKKDAVVYHALSTEGGMNRSVFWIVNKSDADKLENIGYDITKVNVKKGEKPYALTTGEIGSKPDYYAKGGGIGEDDEEFVVHGHYTVSNSGGYEIMLSDSGDAARVRDAFGSENPETSDWLDIEYVTDEEGEPDEDGNLPSEPVIDPEGYNIPLNLVMRSHFKKGGNLKKTKYIVFYVSEEGQMRERLFGEDEKELADDFSKKVNGSVAPIKLAKGGAVKQKSAQYKIDGYGSGDRKRKAKPVGFRYERIRDPKTGKLRVVTKEDKKYYATPTQKEIKAYKDGDVTARKMLGFENRADHSDKEPVRFSRKFAKGGSVTIGEHKATFKVKYSLDGEKQKDGYIVSVLTPSQHAIDYYLLYDKSKKLVKKISHQESQELVKDKKIILVKRYDVPNEKQKSNPDTEVKDMSYAERREWIKENIVPNLKSAVNYWNSYNHGSFDSNDKKSEKEFLDKVRESAMYGSTEAFEKATSLKVDDSGWGLESPEGEEFEQVASDNTYNSSYLGLFNWNFRIYSVYDVRFVLIAHPHMGGDVRGNYGDPIFLEGESKEDVLMKFYEEVVDGKHSVNLEFKDGTSVTFDAQQDSDVNYYELYDDGSKKKKIKLGSPVEILTTTFKTFGGHKGDDFVEEIVDEFEKNNTNKKEKGGSLDYDDFEINKLYKNSSDGQLYTFIGRDNNGDGRLTFIGKDKIKRIFPPSKMSIVDEFERSKDKNKKKMSNGGGVGEELMGGQPNTSKPSGYKLISKKGKEIIVSDDGGKTKELWYKNNGFVGYTLHYEGNQYEFVESFANGGGVGDIKVGDIIILPFDMRTTLNGVKSKIDENKKIRTSKWLVEELFTDTHNNKRVIISNSKERRNTYLEKVKQIIGLLNPKYANGGGVGEPIAYTHYGHWGKRAVPIYYEKEIKGSTFHLVRNTIPKGDKGEGKLAWDIVMDGVSMGTASSFENGKKSIDNWFNNYAKGGGLRKFQEDDFVIGIAKNKYYGDKGQIFGYTDQTGNPIAKGLVVVRMLDNSGLKYIPETDLDFYNPKGVPLSEKNKARLKELFPNEPHNLPRYQEEYEARSSKGKMANGGELSSSMIGKSLSSGTLKSEHLIESFMDFLQSVKVELGIEEKVNNLQEEVNALEKDEDGDFVGESEETATYILNEDIFDLLNNIAPEGTSFGSHEGNGSDFGFWEYENDEEFAKGGGVSDTKKIKKRLEYLRKELRAERISQGELIELESLAKYIDKGDVELLEAAGVPEFEDEVEEEKFRYKDIYSSQGGMTFETAEEVEEFIKRTKPFIRKELKKGNFVVVYNGKEYFIGEKLKINDEYADGGGVGESILIKNIIGKYEKKYGYKPSKQELNNLYSSGQLSLTDEEENELIKYFNEYADGGGLDNTEEIKERLEYLRGELREERISQGELIELQSLSKYIDKGDVELLEAAGVPEFDDEEFAKGGSLKKTKAKYVELLNEIGVPEHDHPEYGGRVPYKHLNTYGLWLRKNDPIAFNVGYSDWAGEDDYKKGGAIKQRGAQYERDVPYGSRDTSVQSRLVGYRYRKILDKSTGMMRKIKKTDKEYYKPVTQKDIKAYEEGDVKARKMIYQENRRDHSDKNPKNKRAY